MDVYGYLQIKGRVKDIIIRGGENIYPAEIEKVLYTHPKVKEAQVSSKLAFHRTRDGRLTWRYRQWIAYGIENVVFFFPQVVGVEDFRMGEEICVFIRLRDGQDCAVEGIRDYCREKVRQQWAASVVSLLCLSHTHQLPLCCFQMASFKIPRYVFFVNSFPISSSGKVSPLKSDCPAELSFPFLEWMLLWFLRLKEQICDKWVHHPASGSRLSLLGSCLRRGQCIWVYFTTIICSLLAVPGSRKINTVVTFFFISDLTFSE